MEWLKQKERIDALNLFHSAIKTDTDSNGLASQGYKLVGPFLPVSDRRNNVLIRPDFTFYSGETVIFVNIEIGDELTDQHRNQAKLYQELNLEAVEEFIQDKGRAGDVNLSTRNLDLFEHYLVFNDKTVQKAKAGGPGASIYDDIRNLCGVLSQSKGGKLLFEDGLSQDDSFHDILSSGINLPRTPSKEFLLAADIKPESLAVSLAQEILPEEFKHKETVKMTPREVRQYYNRHIEIKIVQEALEYLRYRGVCEDIGTYEYSFERDNIRVFYEVEEHLRDTTVDEYLNNHGGKQFSMADYTN